MPKLGGASLAGAAIPLFVVLVAGVVYGADVATVQLPDTATAELPDKVQRILVLDITTHSGTGAKQNRVFCFPGEYPVDSATISKDKNALRALEKAKRGGNAVDPVKDGLLWSYLRSPRLSHRERLALVTPLAGKSSNRWKSAKGHTVGICVFADSGEVNLSVDEVERLSRLTSDVVTLVKFAAKGGFVIAKVPPDIALSTYNWELQRTRATLTITATARASADGAAKPASPADKAGAKAGNQAQASLLTGPGEHFFLSVNLPLTKLTEITLNDSAVAAPTEKPKRFLIGVNVMVGDLLADGGYGSHGFGGLTIGGFCEASAKPDNSLGFMIGWRFTATTAFGFELDTFSPFVGWERTVRESKDSAGSTVRRHVLKPVFGVSFNLDRALGWAGSGGKGK